MAHRLGHVLYASIACEMNVDLAIVCRKPFLKPSMGFPLIVQPLIFRLQRTDVGVAAFAKPATDISCLVVVVAHQASIGAAADQALQGRCRLGDFEYSGH